MSHALTHEVDTAQRPGCHTARGTEEKSKKVTASSPGTLGTLEGQTVVHSINTDLLRLPDGSRCLPV